MRLRTFTLVCFAVFSITAYGQKKDTSFQKEWLGIDTLIANSDLTRTALDKVNALYQKAKQKQLPAQVIKTLIYRYSLEDKIKDNDPNHIIVTIKKEIDQSTDDVQRSILYTLLAKQYFRYYQNNRWILMNRKNTVSLKQTDIATWSTDDFTKNITQYFLRSIAAKTKLLQQKVDNYDAVVIDGNTRSLRPTMYDLLAHEALDYFKSSDINITRVEKTFTLNDPNTLAPAQDFIRSKFTTSDSSQKWMAIQLYQQLLSLHISDADKNALIAIDLDRIEWVHQQANFPSKETAYQQALENITEKYGNTNAAAQAWYLLARIESTKADSYNPFGDTTNRYARVKAREIIEKKINSFRDNSEGVANMKNLLLEIKRKELRTQAELVNIPGKPMRALVSYKNVDTVYVRVVPVKERSFSDRSWEPGFWKKLTGMKYVQSFTQALPVVNDHQLHNVEIKIDELPVGQYMLLTSAGNSFRDSVDKLSAQYFSVSNISYVKNKNDFFVVRRDNGQPVPNAAVTVLKTVYDNKTGIPRDEKIDEKTTDKNGFFYYKKTSNTYAVNFLITKGNDQLDPRNQEMVFNEDTEMNDDDYMEKNRTMYFYTDRSIYRPGQTISFKGIAISRNPKTKLSKLYTTKKKDWAYLTDRNGKKVDSVNFVLNDYGSFSGSFKVPMNVLTGSFNITVKNYHQVLPDISVEEYKRPTFNVLFDKVKGAYRINDSITVTGTANAFAGNHIDGAKVVYNVNRTMRITQPWYYSRPYPMSNNRQISHGEITTDASGKFSITFKADADDVIDKTGKPVFNFSVSADVTDISGETRSNNTSVAVGVASLLLQVDAPAVVPSDSLKKIKISTTNLSYEKEPAAVQLRVFALQAPDRMIRKRYWTRPDQFVISKKDFIKDFPTDEYEMESDMQTWPVNGLISETVLNTKDQDSLAIVPGSWKSGVYKIEAIAKDKSGEEVKAIQYIEIFNPNQVLHPVYQFNYSDNNIAKPGETVKLIRNSSVPQLFVVRRTDRPNKKTDYIFLDKKAGFETIAFTPDENDRGGVSISEMYVYDNRVYTHDDWINVPWNNKALDVKYASYRDKTEPGNKETWTVTVQNDKQENAPAELMTGMYDASLDEFKTHNWNAPSVWPSFYNMRSFTGASNFTNRGSSENSLAEHYTEAAQLAYDRLATNAMALVVRDILRWQKESTIPLSFVLQDGSLEEAVVTDYGTTRKTDVTVRLRGNSGAAMQEVGLAAKALPAPAADGKNYSIAGLDGAIEQNGNTLGSLSALSLNGKPVTSPDLANIVARTNFNETAFFFPQLNADSSGKYSFSFTIPESLTQWKWISLAHTKDLSFGTNSANITTQKKLMVQSNSPRFLREGDNMEFSSKIVNMGEKEITGQVTLELVDPVSNTSIDGWFQNVFPVQYFTVAAGQSFAVKFPIQVPFSYNRPVTWRVKAVSGEFSDGEENILPVLTNRTLVTETLPLFLDGDTTQHFTLDKLLNNKSESLTHESITVEYTTNPVWYAVQALPYLMEYPYECAEQTFNRLYANLLASYIVNKNQELKQVFEQWKKDSTSLKSNLQKNEELKQVLLQETPWVMQAESEEQQKKNIALLFDVVKLSTQTEAIIEKLQQQQLPNGSFSWFKGGYEDRYITNYILTGIGKLKRLGAIPQDIALRIRPMLVNALSYADKKIAEDYNQLIKSKADLNTQHISAFQIDYLFMRSFFRDIAQQAPKEYEYYFKQGKQFWIKQNSYYKAELGLIYYRNGEEKFATNTIIPALLENVVMDSKQGMYWKAAYTGFWYQSPIEHQSMMIAFMSEVNLTEKNPSFTRNIDAMKTWLLLNKQTNNWRTTIATADACYALLLNGTDWLEADKKITIQLGKTVIDNSKEKTMAGTGYFKKRIESRMINNEMGNITVTARSTNTSNTKIPSWGNIYWQYFEDLDKITPAATPLSLTKKLFVERNTAKGKVLDPVKDNEELKTGDKIIVRIELRSDRDMDYLHLKDMRAASMEPVNVLSHYKWQDGLGYYESTKDASTNFFIDHLRKGTYVFDYPLFITHTGIFSVGIATIQCMYAPEFTSHSAGIKIRVAK